MQRGSGAATFVKRNAMKAPAVRAALHSGGNWNDKAAQSRQLQRNSHIQTPWLRCHPALYSFASRLTDGPRQALLLADHAFDTTLKQLSNCCDENVFASLLFANVIRASKQLGLAGPDATLKGRMGR